MKIQPDSKTYSDLKECLQLALAHSGLNLENYYNQGLSETRFLWDHLWAGLILNNRKRLCYEPHNMKDNSIAVFDCNDDHILTVLRRIYKELEK